MQVDDRLCFEVFELIPADPPQLFRVENGLTKEIPLRELEASMLVFLANEPKRWKSINDLAEKIWGDSLTAPNAIQATAKRLRKALSEYSKIIQGGKNKYRLNADVRHERGHANDLHPSIPYAPVDEDRGRPEDLAGLILSEADSRLIQGITLRRLGQYDLSILSLEAAIRDEPNYPRLYSNLAYAYEKNGDLSQAIAKLQTAIQIRRDDGGIEWPRYHFHIARYFLKRRQDGDQALAREHLALAILGGSEWLEEVKANFATFQDVLADAMRVAESLKQKAMELRDTTTAQIRREIMAIPNGLHGAIYGSYWLNGAARFRDIDVVVVTNSRSDKADLITTSAGQQDGTPINIYVVPNNVLQADITSFTNGQFYSYKFILGAEGVWEDQKTDAYALGIVQQAIRDAIAWSYRTDGKSVFQYRYSTRWFIARAFQQRIVRDRTFLRCLRRVFDHYTQRMLDYLNDLYGRALRELCRAGELASGPDREGLWTLNPEYASRWATSNSIRDSQVAERFWQTYEEFKKPCGRAALQAKQAMFHSWSKSYEHDIENRIEELRQKGRVSVSS